MGVKRVFISENLMKIIKLWWFLISLVVSSIWVFPIYANDSNCKGRLLNPLTDINWNMIFPIRIAGVKATAGQSSSDSSATATSALCICPGHIIHLPTPGILVTYHQPLYVEEIAKTPGCLSSLGGLSI